jgi:hypothetical protein
MMMNPAYLEAESVVVRADAPRQAKPMLRGEPHEQARRVFFHNLCGSFPLTGFGKDLIHSGLNPVIDSLSIGA